MKSRITETFGATQGNLLAGYALLDHAARSLEISFLDIASDADWGIVTLANGDSAYFTDLHADIIDRESLPFQSLDRLADALQCDLFASSRPIVSKTKTASVVIYLPPQFEGELP